jgi:hypothetical protein
MSYRFVPRRRLQRHQAALAQHHPSSVITSSLYQCVSHPRHRQTVSFCNGESPIECESNEILIGSFRTRVLASFPAYPVPTPRPSRPNHPQTQARYAERPIRQASRLPIIHMPKSAAETARNPKLQGNRTQNAGTRIIPEHAAAPKRKILQNAAPHAGEEAVAYKY